MKADLDYSLPSIWPRDCLWGAGLGIDNTWVGGQQQGGNVQNTNLHIDGIFNAGRFYAVNVDPPVNSNSIPAKNYIYTYLIRRMQKSFCRLVKERVVRIWLRCSLCRDWHHTQKLSDLLLLTTAKAEKAREVLLRRNKDLIKSNHSNNSPTAIRGNSDELCDALDKRSSQAWIILERTKSIGLVSSVLSIQVVDHHGVMATVDHHCWHEKLVKI